MEGLEPQSRVSQGFFSQWPTLPCWRQGQVSSCSSRSSKSWVWAIYVRSRCVLSSFPALVPLPHMEQFWSKRGQCRCLMLVWVWVVASLITVRVWTAFNSLPLWVPLIAAPASSDTVLGLNYLCHPHLSLELGCRAGRHGWCGSGCRLWWCQL